MAAHRIAAAMIIAATAVPRASQGLTSECRFTWGTVFAVDEFFGLVKIVAWSHDFPFHCVRRRGVVWAALCGLSLLLRLTLGSIRRGYSLVSRLTCGYHFRYVLLERFLGLSFV